MSIQGVKKVLVAGIAGQLGGVIVPRLLSEGHSVRVITDDTEMVRKLKGQKVDAVQGSVSRKEELHKALEGIDGVCLMGAPHEVEPANEVKYGKAVVDACVAKKVGHVVYVSVCCSDKNSGVPHFESKYEIEGYLKGSGLSHTILRPAWYMENFTSKRYLPSIEKGVLSMPLRPERTLELISASDVARIVALAFTVPDKFSEREIDLAAERLTMEEIAEEISLIVPKKVVYKQISERDAAKETGREMAVMFKYLDQHGFTGDILLAENLLKRFEISLTSFRSYLDSSRGDFRKAA